MTVVVDWLVEIAVKYPEVRVALEHYHLWRTPVVALLASVAVGGLWVYFEAAREE